jgi:nicotinate-nucleotide pyrophosphorylase (carboxylating)
MSAEQAPALAQPLPVLYRPLLRRALREDLGGAGDITSDAIVPRGLEAAARVVARKPGRIAGLEICLEVFPLLDRRCRVELAAADGSDARAGQILATVRGPARALLAGERTALNLLGRLCGVATATRDLVALVEPYRARVVCTRKTTPGLRLLEKFAVRAGGGANHRFGLDDAVLIKDNHRVIAGGVREALARVRARAGHMVKVEVEVDTLEQLEDALALGADAVLLDNMAVDVLAEAVRRVGGRMITEASGGITPERAREVAATGVDLLSVGWITHSAPQLDVALDLEI